MSDEALTDLPVVEPCWSRIGIRGDRSCPELQRVIHCNNCPVFARAAQTLLDRPVPDDYLAELGGFVAEPARTNRVADRAVVLFGVGAEWFAVPSVSVLEVAEAVHPRRVPHRSNDVFVGVTNIRGQLELCMSLHGLLGLPRETAAEQGSRALVISVDGHRWVLLIDCVRGVHRFRDEELIAAPPASRRRSNEYVRGLILQGDRHFGLLDLMALCAKLQEKLQ